MLGTWPRCYVAAFAGGILGFYPARVFSSAFSPNFLENWEEAQYRIAN
jgi:hypothetical protein